MLRSRFLSDTLDSYASVSIIDPARIGSISSDRSAIIGKNNWCFIYEGANKYVDAYTEHSLSKLADDWANLVELRQKICEKKKITFLQVIVPNKASLLPESFPELLPSDMTVILREFLGLTPISNYLCPINEMRDTQVRDFIFRRNDSHLTISGNVFLLDLILKRLNIELKDPVGVDVKSTTHIGDLGSKFESKISECITIPKFDSGLLIQCQLEKIDEVIVAGFNGTKQSFYNPNAPIKKSLVVFGNSFVERVPSWGLGPFFAALFERYCFIWTPNFEIDVVESLSPDIVIALTCERFLPRIPNS